MYVNYPINQAQAGRNLLAGQAAWRALEENVQGFMDDAERRPEDQTTDSDRQRRIDPGMAGQNNCPAAHNDGSGGKRISKLVDEGATDIHVMGGAEQKP